MITSDLLNPEVQIFLQSTRSGRIFFSKKHENQSEKVRITFFVKEFLFF